MNLTKDEFMKEYMGTFPPPTFLEWIERLCKELDCIPPNQILINDREKYLMKLAAWDTQMSIRQKLLYAVKFEKQRLERQ